MLCRNLEKKRMTSSFSYYIFCIIAVIIGFFVIKKIASCLIKTIVLIAAVAIMAAIYFMYIK